MENERINNKDNSKIILFVIGVLVGAVISTAAFLVYTKTLGTGTSSDVSGQQQMQGGGTPPEMPNGQGGPNGQGEQNSQNSQS